MINVFFIYCFVWGVVLLLHLFGWSDLISPLNPGLAVFIIISIVVAFALGMVNRKKLKFVRMKKNPLVGFKELRKDKKLVKGCMNNVVIVLIVLYAFFAIEMLISGRVPLLEVMKGEAYSESKIEYLPFLHMLFSVGALTYDIYLAHAFASFKDKRALLGIVGITGIFLILVQRQFVFISILLVLNMVLAAALSAGEWKKRALSVAAVVVGAIIALFGFGVMGNMRYGDRWEWNDSSMISSVGMVNDQYPDFVPKEFAWGYVYIVSPLENLNYNVAEENTETNYGGLLSLFVPDFVANKVTTDEAALWKQRTMLISPALTVCTGYLGAYIYAGIFGMYTMYAVWMVLFWGITWLVYKKRPEAMPVVGSAMIYFCAFGMFDNPFAFSVTFLIVIFSLAYAFRDAPMKLVAKIKKG